MHFNYKYDLILPYGSCGKGSLIIYSNIRPFLFLFRATLNCYYLAKLQSQLPLVVYSSHNVVSIV